MRFSIIVILVACRHPTAHPNEAPVPAATSGITSLDMLAHAPVADEDTSSAAVIERARLAGTLTDEQALLYSVFALFNDARLPAAYKGDDTGVRESDALDNADRAYQALSPDGQTTVWPFLLTPNAQDSWLNGKGAPPSDGPAREPLYCGGTLAVTWKYYDNDSGRVRVWYDAGRPEDGVLALDLKNELETKIWDALIPTFNAPRDDSAVFCNGGDGKVDFYIVPMTTYGQTSASRGETFPRAGGRSFTPAYVYISNTLSGSQLYATAAHELMHVIEYAYPSKADHKAYGWINEALADWAIDFVYPINDVEHDFCDCFTRTPNLALDDASAGHCSKNGAWTRDYGAYLFFQNMHRMYGLDAVRDVLLNTELFSTGLEAVDNALNGGFHETFLEFSKHLYNRAPQDTFKVWDSLADMTKLGTDASLDLGGKPADTEYIPGDINNLATKLYRYTFTDANTRSLLFHNGFFDQIQAGKKIRIWAMWKDGTGTWQQEEWTQYEFVGLCRDLKNQRASELVLVFSNAEWQPGGGGQLSATTQPWLKRTNIGCYKYAGTATLTFKGSSWSGTGNVAASNLSFSIAPPFTALSASLPAVPNSLRAGLTLTMQMTGDNGTFTMSYGQNLCTYSGSGPYTIAPAQGALMLNGFPELKTDDANLKLIIGLADRAYSASGAALTTIPYTATGSGCHGGNQLVGALIQTNNAAGQMLLSPPLVPSTGVLTGTFQVSAGTTNTWTLAPQQEP